MRATGWWDSVNFDVIYESRLLARGKHQSEAYSSVRTEYRGFSTKAASKPFWTLRRCDGSSKLNLSL